MPAERTFIYGYRRDHARNAGVTFLVVALLAALTFVFFNHALWARILMGLMTAFFVWMGVMMLKWIGARERGEYKITVGPTTLRSPRNPMFPISYVEVPYANMKSISTAGNLNDAKVVITHPRGTLEITRKQLGSDEEFLELINAVQSNFKAEKVAAGHGN